MRFSIFGLLPAILYLSYPSTAMPTVETSCTAEKRIELAKLAVDNMKLPTAVESLLAYGRYPFSSDAHIVVNPNGLGDIPISVDRVTALVALAVLYEVVYKLNPEVYLNLDNTSTYFNVTVTLAAGHYVPVPADVYFEANLTFIPDKCKLQAVHATAKVPSAVLGYPLKAMGLSDLLPN